MNGISSTTVQHRTNGASSRHRHADAVRRAPRRCAQVAPVFWMTVLAVVIVAIGVLPAAGDPVPSVPPASIAVRVCAADTLWSIAASHRIQGISTARMVALIEDANPLDGTLEPGTILKVPAQMAPQSAFAQVTGLLALQ